MSILTLNKYKTIKNITNSEHDVQITELIKAVNSYISTYCNRKFTEYYNVDKVEYFDGVNSDELYPEVYPIVSVTSLETSTDGGQNYSTVLTEFTDYVIDEQNSRIVSNYDYFVASSYPLNSVKLTYKAGYTTIPEDLTLAAVNLVEYFLEEQYTPRKSLAGAGVENIIITSTDAYLPAHIRRVLELYRNMSF